MESAPGFQENILESEIENLLCEYPQLLAGGLTFVEKREALKEAGIIDLVFEDRAGNRVLVEVKRGKTTREDIGQVIQYFGSLQQNHCEAVLMFVAQEIHPTFKVALNLLGISTREFGNIYEPFLAAKELELAVSAENKELEKQIRKLEFREYLARDGLDRTLAAIHRIAGLSRNALKGKIAEELGKLESNVEKWKQKMHEESEK